MNAKYGQIGQVVSTVLKDREGWPLFGVRFLVYRIEGEWIVNPNQGELWDGNEWTESRIDLDFDQDDVESVTLSEAKAILKDSFNGYEGYGLVEL